MREADIDDMGLRIGGRNISNMRYADDAGLVGNNITSARRILHRVDVSGKVAGLGMNAPKTKYMHIRAIDSLPEEKLTIKVNGTELEKVDSFKYLGSIKSSDGIV